SSLVGRGETAGFSHQEESAAPSHAIIFEMDGHRYIRDLASRTGTFVNGKQVHQVELMSGDEIKVGETSMRYAAEGEAAVADYLKPGAPADLGVAAEDLVDLEEGPVTPVAKRPAPPPKAVPPAPAPAG